MKVLSKLVNIYELYFDKALFVVLFCVLGLRYFTLLGVYGEGVLIASSVVGVLPVLFSAARAVRNKEWASMDMLASIALVFSLISHEWTSAVFICLMLTSARLVADYTERRTRKNIDSLLKLRPETAKVEISGDIGEVSLSSVRVGDIVIVDTGEYVPVDGEIVSGGASFNEASLTGESLPVEKSIGAKAVSGTLVVSGSVRIKTLLVGKDTTLEKIIALIEQAEEEKSHVQTLGEKFGKAYLSSVFIVSFVLYVFTHNVHLILSVVLVVCADDVAVALPLAYLKAIGSAAKKGVVIKGGKHLETLGKVEAVIFDKTGTVTTGKLHVSSIAAASGQSESEVLRLAVMVARRSDHPLAKAIVTYGDDRGVVEAYPEDASVIEGKGVVAKAEGKIILLGRSLFMEEQGCEVSEDVRAQADSMQDVGASVTYLAVDGRVVGVFALEDTIKAGAKEMVAELYSLGVKRIIMLSGDNEKAVTKVANALGIQEYYANLLPEDKLTKLRKLHTQYIVAMVGDGVNDAAALSISHVGIAMGALGSDAAIESAEIVLMHDNLLAIADTIRLARSVHRIALQDFGIWVVTNVFGLTLVFAGLIGPSGAALYNFISDFFPLLNSMRAKMK